MTIENLINIIDATLINTPEIKKVESATMFPSKVEMGDLFFATDKSSIEKAIDKGAYAIVFEGDVKITDKEIAYLKVDSIKDASDRLLRYVLTKKGSKIYYFKEVEITLLRQISLSRSTLFTILPKNFQKSFELILNSDYNIFITTDLEYAKRLSSNYFELEEMVDGYIISDSLLKTTFKLEKFVYQNIQMPPFFMDNLRKVVHFTKELDHKVDIKKVKYSEDFRPYFIDNNLHIIYSSQKVIIFVKALETVEKALSYLKESGRWTKSIVLTPPKVKLEATQKPYWVDTPQKAKDILKQEFFNYAFCYGIKQEDILEDITNYNLFS
jgi:ferrochelatase